MSRVLVAGPVAWNLLVGVAELPEPRPHMVAARWHRETMGGTAHPVPEVVDTNGAGDAFFAGFLAAHLAGRPLRDCLDRAAAVAAACVRSPGLAPAD